MAEEFQGGVCGGTWWNERRSLGAGGLSSPCSVAQLGGGFDMGSFGWPNHEILIKGAKPINLQHNFDNSFVFPADMDSTLDILGFGLSPTSSTTTNWSQLNLLCNGGDDEGNFGSILLEDEILNMTSSNIMNSNNVSSHNTMNHYNNLDASPTLTGAASSGSPGDSSTTTSEGGLVNTSFHMSSSASYLIQTLFDDTDESPVLEPQLPISQPMNPNYGCVMSSSDLISSPCSWVKPSSPNITTRFQPPPAPGPPPPQLGQNTELDGGMNSLVHGGQAAMNGQYSTTTALSNIRTSLLNSLKSRSRASSFNNQKSHSYDYPKMSKEEVCSSKGNLSNQPPAKRPRIETPSPLPTFKVRKEKLGDHITALQQLVSPFGKTDTASVLHEAIEYIKFLHDQVSALSTPYLKNGAPMQHQQEVEEEKQDLKSRGLCLVPISSTYPVVQETPVDFWTPTFGGPAAFR